jgi:hypothetical protein
MRSQKFTDTLRRGGAGINSRFNGGNISDNFYHYQAALNQFFVEDSDFRGFYHSIRTLNGANQAAGFQQT